MKLQLKFKADMNPAGRRRVIEKATQAGANNVRPMFPGDKDEILASIYVVDFNDSKQHDMIVSLLSAEKGVEFVEDEVKHRLKAPAGRRLS